MEEQVVVDNATAPAEAQKMLTQEQVNALVGREKREAAEKARREAEMQAEAKYSAELERLKASMAQPQQPASSFGGMQQQSADDIYRQIKDRLVQEAQEEARKAEMQKLARTYHSRMAQGSNLFEDFNEVMDEFNTDAFLPIVYLASQMENTPQIMYELAKNPSKLATIHSLTLADPNQAKRALKQLSDSIAHNEDAVNEYVTTNPPLSKPRPSQVGTDKGEPTLADMKRMFRN